MLARPGRASVLAGAVRGVGDREMARTSQQAAGIPEQLYSIEEAGRILGSSRDQIERFIAKGELDYVMVGARRRIPASTLADYQETRRERVVARR